MALYFERCLCGGKAALEVIPDIKAGLLGKQEKTRYRMACGRCKEGVLNIKGFGTKSDAIDDWHHRMQLTKENASELNVDAAHFLMAVNS